MKYTIEEQIHAIQRASSIIGHEVACGLIIRDEHDKVISNELLAALNDAGSTLAAINLNPELKKIIES